MSDVFEAVLREHRAFFRGAAIAAGHEIGLFRALAGGPAALGPLARRLGVGARRLGPLVAVLALEGAVRKEGGKVALVTAPPPPSPPLPAAGWGRLATVLRSDRPLPPEPPTGEAAARYHAHLLAVGATPARELAAALVTADVRRVLDAGCGAGAYAAACLAARDDVRATLVDAPAVLDRARAHLGGLAERADFLPGDVATAPLAADHDLGLLVNVLHLHGPATAAALVRRVAAAVAPGGRVVVKDLAIADDRSGPPAALYFALDMALYTESGDVHAEADLRGWLAAAGVGAITRLPLSSSPGSIVLAGRRAAYPRGDSVGPDAVLP